MIVIVIGSGAREHALCRLINKSKLCEKIFCLPGNYGISKIAECINLSSSEQIIKKCKEINPDLVVIGPEKFLDEGLADKLRKESINVFGPNKEAAKLESSKDYMKLFCNEFKIPTAYSKTFDNFNDSINFLENKKGKIVVKYDGLAAGKGVFVCENIEDARLACRKIFVDKIFSDQNKIIIEEYIEGKELSYFVLVDNKSYEVIGSAQDYKRIGDNDTGPNTGGMGTLSPAPILDSELENKIITKIVEPTVKGIHKKSLVFNGVIFLGIIVDNLTSEPKLLEYNTRFGDPEIQSISMRLKSDFLVTAHSVSTNKLSYANIKFYDNQKAICLVLATKGYPNSYPKGTVIRNLEKFKNDESFFIFHAATVKENNQITTNGGRVLSLVAINEDYEGCRNKVYKIADEIDWKEKYFRLDIGLID
ncbi:MAG: phosphoribosylamine--glycine ligase [Pelagibacteraceae bacterium]|nr:phosphoribosylamine--glycine ligase [Pelagibacteraceae bacterium]